MHVLFYGNGSSGNHGCEAIVRGTIQELNSEENTYSVLSANPDEDLKYGLAALSTVRAAKSERKRDLRFLSAYAKLKLTGNYTDMDGLYYLPSIDAVKERVDIALSVGGDNYCYGGTEIYAYLNRAYQKRGIKTVLWGCSIEPEVVQSPAISNDLQRYSLIVARESITYEAVHKARGSALLAPDPAFFMSPVPCKLDERFDGAQIIGINASPHILKCETASGMAYENYRRLVQYILSNTNASIALIPHVVWDSNDDRSVLQRLYDDFDRNERLILVEDHTAPELKYIISKCSFFVGARTHATIAAYSTGVPTLVVGYSVKARGIARDLFGTEENYVLPVQELREPEQLTKAFCCLYEREREIREYLNKTLPEYLKRAEAARAEILKLANQ